MQRIKIAMSVSTASHWSFCAEFGMCSVRRWQHLCVLADGTHGGEGVGNVLRVNGDKLPTRCNPAFMQGVEPNRDRKGCRHLHMDRLHVYTQNNGPVSADQILAPCAINADSTRVCECVAKVP